jgi:hypothetical protein
VKRRYSLQFSLLIFALAVFVSEDSKFDLRLYFVKLLIANQWPYPQLGSQPQVGSQQVASQPQVGSQAGAQQVLTSQPHAGSQAGAQHPR